MTSRLKITLDLTSKDIVFIRRQAAGEQLSIQEMTQLEVVRLFNSADVDKRQEEFKKGQ